MGGGSPWGWRPFVREVKGDVGRGEGECEGAHRAKDRREVAGFDE
jgi:hypothetical protein